MSPYLGTSEARREITCRRGRWKQLRAPRLGSRMSEALLGRRLFFPQTLFMVHC